MTNHMIWLTDDGKVVLGDEMLISIEQSGTLSGGGYPDPPTTNGTCGGFNTVCHNDIHCSTTHNKTCTNHRVCPVQADQIDP